MGLEELKRSAREYERQHPNDLQGQLQKWQAVLEHFPEDREAGHRVRELLAKIERQKKEKELEHLYQEARRAYERGGVEDVKRLRDIRNEISKILREFGFPEKRRYREDVQKWYQELSDRHGRPTTLKAQGKYLEALREAERVKREGKEKIYDPEREELVPLVDFIDEVTDLYVGSLPGILETRWQDIEKWLPRDPERAEAILKEAESFIQAEVLPLRVREDLAKTYRPILEKYRKEIEAQKPYYRQARKLLEKARREKDPLRRWRYLIEAGQIFPNLPELDLEKRVAQIAFHGAIRTRGQQVLRRVKRALREKKFVQARKELEALDLLLAEFEADLPEEWRSGGAQRQEIQKLFREVDEAENAHRRTLQILEEVDRLLSTKRYHEAQILLDDVPARYKDDPEVQKRLRLVERAQRLRAEWQEVFQDYEFGRWDQVYPKLARLINQHIEDPQLQDEAHKMFRRVKAIGLFQIGRKREADGQIKEALAFFERAKREFEEAGGPDASTSSEYESLQQAIERVKRRLDLHRSIQNFLNKSSAWSHRPLRTPEDLARLLKAWEEGRELLAKADVQSQEGKALSAFLQALQEQGNAYFLKWVQSVRQRTHDVGWLKALLHLWDKALDIGFLDADESNLARHRELERLYLDAQRAAWKQQVPPAPCTDRERYQELIRNLERRKNLAQTAEEINQIEEEARWWRWTCFAQRWSAFLAESPTSHDIRAWLDRNLQDEPVLANDPIFPGYLIKLLAENEQWDVLEYYVRHPESVPWPRTPIGRKWTDVLQELVAGRKALQDREGRAVLGRFQRIRKLLNDLDKMTGEKHDVRSLGLEAFIQTSWAEQLAQHLREFSNLDPATTLHLLLAYANLSGERLPSTLEHRRRELRSSLRRYLHEQYEKLVEAAIRAFQQGGPEDWEEIETQHQELDQGVQNLSEVLEISRESVKEFRAKWQNLSNIVADLRELQRRLHALYQQTRVPEALRKLSEIREDLQEVLSKSMRAPRLYEVLDDLARRLDDMDERLRQLQADMEKWREAVRNEDFQQALALLESIEENWMHLKEQGLSLKPPELLYVVLGDKQPRTTFAAHREALEVLHQNVMRWENQIQALRQIQAHLHERFDHFTDEASLEVLLQKYWEQEPKSLKDILQDLQDEKANIEKMLRTDDLPCYSRRADELKREMRQYTQELHQFLQRLEDWQSQIRERLKAAETCYSTLRKNFLGIEKILLRSKRNWPFGRTRRVSRYRIKELEQLLERCRQLDPYYEPELQKRVQKLLDKMGGES